MSRSPEGPWVRFPLSWIDDPELTHLTLAQRSVYYDLWMLAADNRDFRGWCIDERALTAGEIASRLCRGRGSDKQEIVDVLDVLRERGLIVWDSELGFGIADWDKHQFQAMQRVKGRERALRERIRRERRVARATQAADARVTPIRSLGG